VDILIIWERREGDEKGLCMIKETGRRGVAQAVASNVWKKEQNEIFDT